PVSGPVPDVVELVGVRSLEGEVHPPGDKSISHRAVLLGALGAGRSTVTGLSDGADVAATVACVSALGAVVRRGPDGALEVDGGRDRLASTEVVLQCGNSGTTMRLLSGVVASIDGVHALDGDASLRRRPMDRVAVPLRRMGAQLDGRGESCTPPVTVMGSSHLRAVRYELPVASAQVKSAVLLAGLAGDGPTTVVEPIRTRAHTEAMLARARARVEVTSRPDGRHTTVWPSEVSPCDWHVPRDPSQAAFLVVAGLLCERAEVLVRDVELSEERRGFVEVLSRMGANLVMRFGRDDVGDLVAVPATLGGTEVAASEVPSLDEVPVLAVAAAAATGTTTFLDAGELRVKESDRAAATLELVRGLGAEAAVEGDALSVRGLGSASRFRRVEFDAKGDHRMAMAAAVAATVGQGGVVAGFAGVATSYPSFLAD
ncbi:MAG TPA: 3-phosphoshikimate 1-carboxyvinyltransferase, partial [Acidimicrobiales bacterium]|nr:3-phosphoshikimate 1-carboxyvinyltransferase [Acidimicrobiales bacterium]